MASILPDSVFDQAVEEIRRKSKLKLYQTDFDAWAWDVLRLRNYEKMRKIAFDALFGAKERTLVKSGNGTGKSVLQAQMVLWAGSVFPVGETVSIISAPSIPQLQKVTFAYLKSFHGRVSDSVKRSLFRVPGHIDENLGWVVEGRNGKVWLASGRKPPDQDAVSMFQGLRSQYGMTYVWFDEAGGMSRAMYTAAEAVMTGDLARFFGIGNPDNAGTDFQDNFDQLEKAVEYNLHTISAYDTPVFTGERVYPRTPEGDKLEKQMLGALTSKRWVAHKTRIWATGGVIVPDPDHVITEKEIAKGIAGTLGDPDPRYFRRVDKVDADGTVIDKMKWDARGLSKVMGEFPGENDTAFFPQALVTAARAMEIEEDMDVRPVLGVDIARYGPDESVIMLNRGGRVRVLASWGKTGTVESARNIHQNAMLVGAAEVRIDAAGIGGAVFDMLKDLEEFSDKTYLLIGVDGGSASTDNRRWANTRAENHDQLRLQMAEGRIDIDYDDEELRDQLLAVTYKFNNRGAIQITPKDEMRTEMEGSPDRLDALIYSVIDTSRLFRDPDALEPGDITFMDPYEMVETSWWAGENYPL